MNAFNLFEKPNLGVFGSWRETPVMPEISHQSSIRAVGQSSPPFEGGVDSAAAEDGGSARGACQFKVQG